MKKNNFQTDFPCFDLEFSESTLEYKVNVAFRVIKKDRNTIIVESLHNVTI